jgi:hypothetical protein
MITLHKLLSLYGLEPKKVKLLRHSNAEIPIMESFRNDVSKLESYQSFQSKNKFSGAKHIASFAPHHGTTALFLGLWDITGSIESDDYSKELHSKIDQYDEFPDAWHDNSVWYRLKRNDVMDDLSERLVIEWGKATVAWVQTQDKQILEIKGKGSIGDFISYDDIQLNYYELKKIVDFEQENFTWVSALSSVNGIYLIQEKKSGGLYVGSSYGENGLFGRWSNYAKNGHGGNKKLKNLDPSYFEFSILEIVTSISSKDEVIARENKWKEKLGTKDFGLNSN